MAKGKNKPKLTNKQIEQHLNTLYGSAQTLMDAINRIMKVIHLYADFNGHEKDFDKFLEEKIKKDKKSDNKD